MMIILIFSDADFIYAEWQFATYYFVNVAPQWQAFNNGNWKAIEIAVREYAKNAQRDIQVYTGTLGTLKHKGINLFLAKQPGRSGEWKRIPVPEFYWKIVHDPVVDEAIVFVGLNNPHFSGENPEIEVQICPDICAENKWFFLYQKNVNKGYSYCCSYQDFKGIIDWAPDIGDPDVLQNILVLN